MGTSGWQYRHWAERFYPESAKQARWLEHYSARFQTVEVNNTFYRLPEAATFKSWAERVPADFVYAVKATRYLTHIRRLKDSKEPVGRLVDRIRHLGTKLGPVLIQLPPNLQRNPGVLSEALDAFPSNMKLAVEFRHPSWFDDETKQVLASHSAALCLADRQGSPSTPLWKTADWTYLRLHQGDGSPHPCYRRETLRHWVERLGAHWEPENEVFVYFNNDPGACALADAITFAEIGADAGLKPTRVPGHDEVKVSG